MLVSTPVAALHLFLERHEAILGALLPGMFGSHMYVAWFSVSNFVTAGLLPYVMPFDQGLCSAPSTRVST